MREKLKLGLRQRKLEHYEVKSLTEERTEGRRRLYHDGYQDNRTSGHSVCFLSLCFSQMN